MRAENKFLGVIALAAAAATAGYLALTYLAGLEMRGRFVSADERTAVIALAGIPACIAAAWWLFGQISTTLPRREARAVAIAFAVCSAVSLEPAILHAQDRGMPAAARSFGTPLFWLALFGTVTAMEIAANLIVSVFVLWALRNALGRRSKAG